MDGDNPAVPDTGATPAATPEPSRNPAPEPSQNPAPAADPAPFEWAKAPGIDADALGYVQSKGWKDVGELAKSYRNAEKMLGVPPDQVVKIPKEGADDATMGQIYDKLGRPSDPTGYSISVPEEGGDPELAKAAAPVFHEAGLNQKQVEKIVGWWNETAGAAQKAQQEQIAARDAEQIARLKTDWGPQEQANTALVDRAARAFGMDNDQVMALRQVMGPGDAMKFLYNIGSKLGVDDTFVNPQGGGSQQFGGMSPEQAKTRIAELVKDPGFIKRFAAADADARKEMHQLNRAAYPEQ